MAMRLSPELTAKCLALAGAGPAPLTATISEKDFMQAVKDEATHHGWRCFHNFDARKSEAGFPDLVLARGNRLIFAELKTMTGQLTADQLSWGEVLGVIGGTVEYYVWRPDCWPKIIEMLK